MRIRKSRSPFPILYLNAQENASVSSQDKSKRDSGTVMTDPELLDQLQLDEAKQIGRSSFAPDMLKPVSKRHKGTGNRGRAASKPGIHTRKRRRPEYPTIIVLGLRAHLPSDHKNPTPRRKSRRKVDKNEAAETRLVSAVSPKKDPSGPGVSKEAKSNNCEWRSELSLPPSPPNDTVEDRDKEDQRLFLEVVEALQRVKPKRRRGRPKKVPTDQLMEVEIE
ncbi:unnamed protein product [Linum trigynum]|uniref:Uncharacterized protein n=1 Tax=Linum trigynum TaxID=586398 RepID=A0AAV2GFG6_9ROSI